MTDLEINTLNMLQLKVTFYYSILTFGPFKREED